MGTFTAVRRFFGFDHEAEEEPPVPARPLPPPTSGAFRVGEKIAVKGEISGEGDIELLGRFEGSVNVVGTVVVGEGAEVQADIAASTIYVGGRVRGNLTATGRVEILSRGTVTGNLKGGSLSARDGASVKGEIWVERSGRVNMEVSG